MSVVQATSFGHYRLTNLLGSGGMGDVWRAHDTRTDRIVAVKLLPRKLANDEIFKQRFRREAHAAAQLNEPHVVPIHSYGEIDGQLYVDMRLIEGRDLQKLLTTTGPLKPARAVMIVEQVAKALYAAHNVGLVHRDVKPSNILVADYDFAYLIDFGIARGAGENTLTSIGSWVGTPYYMAPERFRDGAVDARADIYALACVLHECLTGATPFPGLTVESQMTAHLTMPPPRPSVVLRGVPPTFDAVIAEGMAKDPDHRHQTALELATAARSATTTSIPTIPPPPFAEQPTVQRAALFAGDEEPTETFGEPATPQPPRNRRRLAMIGATSSVVVLALVTAVSLWGGTEKPAAIGPEIFLEPATAVGQNPFTPSTSIPLPPAMYPGTDPAGAPVSGRTDPDGGPVSGGEVRAVRGNLPDLYGGARGQSPCDTGLMTSSLGQNPDRGQAWASTFNITLGQIPAFISELTPVVLRTDTRVTSHGFANGQASPYQAVLEAGTAVLVNSFGVPVVRCGGGNPLLEPVAVASPRYSDQRWKSFTVGAVTVIRPSDKPVDSFILYDSSTGDSFARPLGGNGSNDFPDPRVPTNSPLPRPPLETQTQAPLPPPPLTRVTDFPTYTPPSITYAPPMPTQLPQATTATKIPRETSSTPRTSYYKPPTTTIPRRDRSGGGSTGTPPSQNSPPVTGSKAPEPTLKPKPPPPGPI